MISVAINYQVLSEFPVLSNMGIFSQYRNIRFINVEVKNIVKVSRTFVSFPSSTAPMENTNIEIQSGTMSDKNHIEGIKADIAEECKDVFNTGEDTGIIYFDIGRMMPIATKKFSDVNTIPSKTLQLSSVPIATGSTVLVLADNNIYRVFANSGDPAKLLILISSRSMLVPDAETEVGKQLLASLICNLYGVSLAEVREYSSIIYTDPRKHTARLDSIHYGVLKGINKRLEEDEKAKKVPINDEQLDIPLLLPSASLTLSSLISIVPVIIPNVDYPIEVKVDIHTNLIHSAVIRDGKLHIITAGKNKDVDFATLLFISSKRLDVVLLSD